MTDQVAGTVLAERYALEDRIGVGGMATVYRAIDLTTGGRVAVKLLSRELLGKNPEEADLHVKRFRREGEILRLLCGTPYVVTFVEQGVSQAGDHYIAMELLEGEQLRFYIGRGKTAMRLRTFAYYGKHLIRGLIDIHAKNLIHRDLAPDNVVITKTREGLPWPKFLDFGIGKSVGGDLDKVTQMLTIMGKPQYFSPEQARGDEPGPPSDVYSLGVMLYEMLTGHVPIEIHGMTELRRIQKESPIPIGHFREGARVPEEVQGVIMRCLEKKPEDRPTLEEILLVVERFSDRLDAGEEFPAPSVSGGEDATSKLKSTVEAPTQQQSVAKPAASGREFAAGDTIGRFQVRERIGRGGMGLVYLAWDPILLREVAIKVASRVEEEKARRAILREARASSHLKSDNVVTIYDAGTEAGTPYIAMEYVHGRTLADIIDTEGPLTGSRFWRLASGILDGLMYAHEGEKPVIHRDLKPANILCSGDVAKIADFGIAIGTAGQHLTIGSRDQSQTGGGVDGSVVTVSPEQANNKPTDHRSDIYSLGCVLYMMSTGRPPFQGNQIATLYQHVTRTPDAPSKVNPALDPAGISPVIMKCLEKDPAKRWQSVREVKNALEPLFRGGAGGARAALRSRVVLVLLAAIVIGLVPVGLWAWNRTAAASDRGVNLAHVAGTSVRSDRPAARYVTKNEIDLELGPQAPGEVRVTASSEGLPPIVKTEMLSQERATVIRIPLPDPGARELVPWSVAIERTGDPEESRKVITVLQDAHDPRVRFQAYGSDLEPTRTALHVVRLRDLTALVEDAGGFDESGTIDQVKMGWDDSHDNVSFTKKRKEDEPDLVWDAVVDATDRAGNRTVMPQLVRVLTPDVVIRTPREGQATHEKMVRVECTGRLPDRSRPVEGLDADDINLGDGAFAAKIVAGSRSGPIVPMLRTVGGYAAELPIPGDFESPEFGFDIEIHFEGEVIKRSSQRFDAKPPVVTASCGGVTVSSAPSGPKPPILYVRSLGSRSEEIACRIDDGPPGVEGAIVEVRIGDGALERVKVDARGEFHLPRADLEEFPVLIEARDEAGNLASLGFSVVRRGLQITSVQLGGREPDSENRVYLQHDTAALRLATVGVPSSDQAFARLFDEQGRERQSVKLDRLGGEAQLFGTPEIRLFPEGRANVSRTLKFVFGPDAASARAYPPELSIVCDREPPEISVTVEGGSDEVRGTRTAGRFPALRVRIRDNVGLEESRPEQLVSWIRQQEGGANPILGPVQVADGGLPTMTDVSFRIEPPPGPPAANVFKFTIEARDRSGRAAAPRSFTIQVTPPQIALSVAGQTSIAAFGASAETPMVLSRENVPVSVRGPGESTLSYVLVAKVFPQTGGETRREFTLSGGRTSEPLEFTLQLPKAGDGRLLEQGRMVFLLQEPEGSSLEELATVYYLLDREAPSWSVSRAGRTLSEAERREWIKVAALSDVRITVSDGRGSGFDDAAIEDPSHAVGASEITPDHLTMRLRDDEAFRDLANREIEIRVRDAAGNVTRIPLKLAHSRDQLEIKRLLTAEGTEPITREGTIVLQKPQLKFVVDSDVAGFEGVRWVVRRGNQQIAEGYVSFREGRPPEASLIEWPGAERAEPYRIEFSAEAPGGFQREPFRSVTVMVDVAPPGIYLFAGGHPITKGERARINDFQDLRLAFEDIGAGLGPEPATVEVAGPSGRRVPAVVSLSRDEKFYRISPGLDGGSGPHSIFVTARDRLGNTDTRQFDVEVSASVPWTPIGPATAPSSRSSTRPDSANVRTLTSDALREKDEERTSIRFKAVRGSADPNAPIKFFMSQTEVTNEQFLRFVDVLRKDQIPRELRFWNDPTLVRKRVESMSPRFDDFRREPNLPVVAADWEVALAIAAWTGGRLPSKDEWVGAAGRYLLPTAEYPVFLDHGVPKSGEYWMRDPNFAVFQRAGLRQDRRTPVTELLRYQANAPFGIVGLAGNVAEWVTSEPGGRRVLGTMGGSFKYPYSDEVNNPRLDRDPRVSSLDAGIRIVWPAQVKAP